MTAKEDPRQPRFPRAKSQFSRSCPPPDIGTATARIEEILVVEEQIVAQLEGKSPQDFPDDGSFLRWKHSATGALGYQRAERKFLEGWIAGDKQQASDHHGRNRELEATQRAIKKKGLAMAMELRAEFQPRYSSVNQPANLDDAHERMSELGIIKMRLQDCFSQLRGEWNSYPLSRDRFASVKAPLQTILSEVEIEIAVLRQFIQSKQLSNDGSRESRKFLIELVKRGIACGVILSPTEQERFDRIVAIQDQRDERQSA